MVSRRTLVAGVLALTILSSCGTADDRAASPPATGTPSPSADLSVATTVASAPLSLPPTSAPTVPAPPTTTASSPTDPARFGPVDAAMRDRVARAGLRGGALLVVRNGAVVHELSVGGVTRSTPLSVASSAKWLTAALTMTFVDEGRLGLDDRVDRWLPEFSGGQPVTVRQLLVHTSGIRDDDCLWNTGGRLSACVQTLARAPRMFAPGTQFAYGNADFHVMGRLLEVIGGTDFATLMQQRVTGPLGMGSTRWPGAPGNPSPAAGLQTTVDDYARFLQMVLRWGLLPNDQRLLSPEAMSELTRNQVAGYDTSRDYAVGITRIPRYTLGAWPDVVDATGTTVVVSGNGGRGFYPWVDFATNSYGIVGVQDDRGAEVAVPASQQVEVAARNAFA